MGSGGAGLVGEEWNCAGVRVGEILRQVECLNVVTEDEWEDDAHPPTQHAWKTPPRRNLVGKWVLLAASLGVAKATARSF